MSCGVVMVDVTFQSLFAMLMGFENQLLQLSMYTFPVMSVFRVSELDYGGPLVCYVSLLKFFNPYR